MRLPAEIIWLKDYVKSWRFRGGYLEVETTYENFNPLLIRVKQVPFSIDKIWEFTGIVTVVDEKAMDEAKKRLFKRLKCMDIELEWRGLLRKKPVFVPSKALSELGLSHDPTLGEYLMADGEIVKYINSIQPADVRVLLEVMHTEELWPFRNRESLISSILSYIENPRRIVWYVTVEEYFIGVRMGSTAKKVVMLIDRISRRLRDFFDEITKATPK